MNIPILTEFEVYKIIFLIRRGWLFNPYLEPRHWRKEGKTRIVIGYKQVETKDIYFSLEEAYKIEIDDE